MFPHVYKEQILRDLCATLYPPLLRDGWDDSAFDLLAKMLEPVPSRRISSQDALEHPFFAGVRK
jgi:serine/threonine protein kinase